MHIVEVELKTPGPTVAPVREPKLDPVATDAKHSLLLFENAQVRVFRSWREPGASESMHEHLGRGRATIFLTDIDTKIYSAPRTNFTKPPAVFTGRVVHPDTTARIWERRILK